MREHQGLHTHARHVILTRAIFRVSKTNYWSATMVNGWTVERRKQQAELIRQWAPWDKSTGPKSQQGKERVARNRWRGGNRQQLRALTKIVNAEIRHARKLVSTCTP